MSCRESKVGFSFIGYLRFKEGEGESLDFFLVSKEELPRGVWFLEE